MLKTRAGDIVGGNPNMPLPAHSQFEPLAYDIPESCRRDGTGRSTKYKALNPDPNKRDGLPFLPSFKIGKRRLILAADHRGWLERLKAASLSAEDAETA